MSHSIRRYAGRVFKSIDCLIEGVSKRLGHIVVKAKPGDDCGLGSQLTIRGGAEPVGSQAYNVLASPKAARDNAVNYQLFPLGQVDKNSGIIAAYSQFGPLMCLGPDGIWRPLFCEVNPSKQAASV